MRVEKGVMVALGYGKYFRSDSIVGLDPIEESEGRGPGRRTRVYIQNIDEPMIASKSESTILRDMVQMPSEAVHAEEQRQLLMDILDTVQDINPMLRTIVREQGKWDLNLLERRIRHTLRGGE
jgi:DNA polymerase/3'-5' exonuclease PolX